MYEALDTQVIRQWALLTVEQLGSQRAEIDALNVFPVPDGDTGTNLYLTLEAAEEAVAAVPLEGSTAEVVEAFARGALLGARGNSGVIASQLLRGLADSLADDPADQLRGESLARALGRASASAYQAVAIPKEGTVLTVSKAAAEGAALAGDDLGRTSRAAVETAREALARTPDQLPVLREAGVVDAGGRGLVVMLEALDDAISGRQRVSAPAATIVRPTAHTPVAGYTGPEYEVMYLLDAEDEAAHQLREQLSGLGDSVVVVGGHGLWNVHVHTDTVGAAMERGVEAGRPHRIRVTRLLEADSLRHQGRGEMNTRALVVVTHGPGMAAYLAAEGVTVVPARPRGRPSTAELLAGAQRAQSHDIVFLPSDKDTMPVAEAAASAARDLGLRASVVPTRSIVQSLAAIAVHDPQARFDDAVIAMGRAAGATRYGAVTTAAREAVTNAGPCRPGDVLGLLDGDIVEIGQELATVAQAVVDRLVSGSTELLTVITGDDVPAGLVDDVCDHAMSGRRFLEIEVLDGGQPHWPLIFGAE